ncbi:AfsA-related hotdog domain-containing protein [Rathayibacter sp. CAU 1779]
MALIDNSAAHRSTRSELLVWGIEHVSGQTWWADVEIPRSHWLCHPAPSQVPVSLLAEAFRQAGLAICVVGLDLGQSVQFVVSSITVNVEVETLEFPRFGAVTGRLEVDFAEIQLRKGLPHILEVDYRLPGLASGHVSARVLSDSDYRAIRRNAQRLGDDIRGMSSPLIEITERADDTLLARLSVDESDPFFFDHAVDHLPGMLLLHAAALLHEDVHGAPPRSLTVAFPTFGELRAETTIRATLASNSLDVAFVQGARTIATATTEVDASIGRTRQASV